MKKISKAFVIEDFGFYRSLLIGFTFSWMVPNQYFNKAMFAWHEFNN